MEKINEESIWRQFLKLSIPIAIANFLQSAYTMTDAFWLGRYNSESLAAVSVCYPIIFLVISLGAGLFVSGTVMVSHHKGRENQEGINYVSSQLILMMVVVSLILSVLGYLASPLLIKMIGAEGLISFGSLSYLQLFFMSTFLVFSFAIYQALMRALGKVWLPLLITFLTVILNFFIDPFFIFELNLGAVGVAWATIFCEAVNVMIALWLLLGGRSGIVLKWSNFKPDRREIRKILAVGIPSSLEQLFRSAGSVFLTFLVTGFGVSSIAAYGVGGEVLGLIMVISLSFMMSTSIIVGRFVGAGKMEKAEAVTRVVAKISFVVLTVIGFFTFFLADDISGLFTPGDIEVAGQSAEYIKIMSFFFGFVGLQQIFNGAFIGAGDTITSMILSFISFWVLRIPAAFILSRWLPFGFLGICWSLPIANLAASLVGYAVFVSGKWKERILS